MPVRAAQAMFQAPGNKAREKSPFATNSASRGTNPFAAAIQNAQSSAKPSTKVATGSAVSRNGKPAGKPRNAARAATTGTLVKAQGGIKRKGEHPFAKPRSQNEAAKRSSLAASTATSNSLPPDQRLQTLKRLRANERQAAIDDGLMADPDVPRQLSEAITLVGTCEDMCPEYERVTRMVQNDVWKSEYSVETADLGYGNQIVDEDRMVKKFRRPAAGIEEQIPSDLRPPRVLQKTVTYLMEDVVGVADGFDGLKEVHNFVWDRTRGIRNDFSVQQLRDSAGLQIAIDCFERIVRFHLLTRHQIGGLQAERGGGYDHQQDLEQCIKGLISLIAYYDLARDKGYISPNEAEFRAYWIITRIPEKREQDVEVKVQSWPKDVQAQPRVKLALEIYASACSASNPQTSSQVIAQQNFMKFWELVGSTKTSYLTACTAEIFFDIVRKSALFIISQSYSRGKNALVPDWTLAELRAPLGFDTEDEVQEYIEAHGFQLKSAANHQWFLDIGSGKSVSYQQLAAVKPPRIQSFSQKLVEYKRFGRTLAAIINGFSVEQAGKAGLIDEENDSHDMRMEQHDSDAGHTEDEQSAESLFVPMHDTKQLRSERGIVPVSQAGGDDSVQSRLNASAPAFNPFSSSKPAASTLTSNPFNFASKSAESAILNPNPFALGPSASMPTKVDLGQSIFSKASSATPSSSQSGSAFNFAPPISSAIKISEPAASESSAPAAPPFSFSSAATTSLPPSASLFSASTASERATPTFSSTTPTPSFTVDQPSTFSFGQPQQLQQHALPTTTQKFFFPPITPTAGPSAVGTLPGPPASTIKPSPTFFSAPPAPFMSQDAMQPANRSEISLVSESSAKQAQSQPLFQFPSVAKVEHKSPTVNPIVKEANKHADSSNVKHVKFDSSVDVHSATPSEPTTKSDAQKMHVAPAGSHDEPRGILKKPPGLSSHPPKVSHASTRAADSGARQRRHEECFDYLAKQLFLGYPNGLLYQYIDYSMEAVFMEEKARFEEELLLTEIRNFREKSLIRRYGTIWRQRTIVNLKKRQALSRRQRMHEASKKRSGATQITKTKTSQTRSQYGETMPKLADSIDKAEKLVKNIDATRKVVFEAVDPPKRLEMKTATSNGANRSSIRAHRRAKTAVELSNKSAADRDNLRSSTSSDLLSRSSESRFLHTDQLADSFRSSTTSGRVSTFSSSYFKLKALGLSHLIDTQQGRGRLKRQRTSSGEEQFSSRLDDSLSKSATRSPSQDIDVRRNAIHGNDGPTTYSPTRKAAMQPGTSLSTKRSRDDVSREDEELFARARAVQSALADGISIYQSEMDELNKSGAKDQIVDSNNRSPVGRDADHPLFNASVISFASPKAVNQTSRSRPALVQSLRASKDSRAFHEARDKLPAFWFRESKFVPRSEYGLVPAPKRSRVAQTARPDTGSEQVSFSSPLAAASQSSGKFDAPSVQFAQGALSQMNGILDDGPWDPHAVQDIVSIDDDLQQIPGEIYDATYLEQGLADVDDLGEHDAEDDDGQGSEEVDNEDEAEEEEYTEAEEDEDEGDEEEEEYDEEEGSEQDVEEEESDEEEHIRPTHLLGGNSAEDAIEL